MITLDRVYKASRVLKEIIRETDMIYAPNIRKGTQMFILKQKICRLPARLKSEALILKSASLRMRKRRTALSPRLRATMPRALRLPPQKAA